MNEIQNLDLLNSTYACFQSSDGKKLEVSLSSPLESNTGTCYVYVDLHILVHC